MYDEQTVDLVPWQTGEMSDLWEETEDDASPICDACGVSALPPEVPGAPSSCENADCDAFGEPICG